MSSHPKTIADRATVLIIGAASFIGAHIVLAFLEFGYKVRATDYNESNAAWLVEDAFKSYADAGSLELLIVPDISAPQAFDAVVKGVSGVVYVANVETKFNPNETIPKNITGTLNALEAASKESSVVRFVQTSSYGAAFTPNLDPSVRLDANSWNEAAVARAWAAPPYDASRFGDVYMASKVAQEQAVWKFMKEKNPTFTINTILPAWVTGKVFNSLQYLSSTACLQGLWDGDSTWLRALQIHSYVSARDVALLHVAAMIDPEVTNERIYAIAKHTDWNDFLPIMRRLYPDRKFMDDLENLGKFQGQVNTSLGLSLLKKWGDREWISVEDGIKDTLNFPEQYGVTKQPA